MSGGWTPTGVRTEAHGIDATSHAHSITDALAAGQQAGRTAALAVRTLRAAHPAREEAQTSTTVTSGVYTATGDPPPNTMRFTRSPASRSAEKRQFVDFQNDVTVADLRQALAEGFTEIEHVKRYTTLGVGMDQGRIGGALGAAILAESAVSTLSPRGRTRAPLQPATLAVLAAASRRRCVPTHRPLHDSHVAHGGEMESMGLWLRPRFYRANGADAGIAGLAEAARVRKRGGLLDGSTLGKIEIAGPAAADFVDRLYLTRGSTIREGAASTWCCCGKTAWCSTTVSCCVWPTIASWRP